MNDGADLSAARVSAMSVLDEQRMRGVLYSTPSCIPAVDAMYIPPKPRQQRGKVGGDETDGV